MYKVEDRILAQFGFNRKGAPSDSPLATEMYIKEELVYLVYEAKVGSELKHKDH
jgi:hypothetical protein